jgi:acyl carrier protein
MSAAADDIIRNKILTVLASVAPELDPGVLDPRINFREQVDFDSLDFLNFVIGLHKIFGVDIPEGDYPKLYSLAGCVDYFTGFAEAGKAAKSQNIG